MPLYPYLYTIDLRITGDNIEPFFELYLDALKVEGITETEKWRITFYPETEVKGAAIEQLLELVNSANIGDIKAIEWDFYGRVGGLIFKRSEEKLQGRKSDIVVFDLSLHLDDSTIPQLNTFRHQCVNICRHMFKQGKLLSAELYPRGGGGAVAFPDVPLIRHNSHITVVTEEAVSEAYEDPQVFWQAGWDAVERYGEQTLLVRGLDAKDGVAYLRQLLPQQWAMARVAKPGLTKYYAPQPEPEEYAIYHRGERKLGVVGHLSEGNIVECTCLLSPGEHINGWEIYDIFVLLKLGELPDGLKVDTVRVVFLDRWAAEQEKRPLLDVGARVYAYDDQGELIEICE